MGGVETMTHWVTGTQMRGYWAYSPSETPLQDVGTWLQTVTETYPCAWLWQGLAYLEAWNPERPDCPTDLKTKSALYYPGDRRILLRTYELSGGQLTHECGHHAQTQLRITPIADRIGIALWNAAVAMLGVKGWAYADQVERFAEAFRYIHYPDKSSPFQIPAGMKEVYSAMKEAR